jgi:hypothetical protein
MAAEVWQEVACCKGQSRQVNPTPGNELKQMARTARGRSLLIFCRVFVHVCSIKSIHQVEIQLTNPRLTQGSGQEGQP